MRTAMGTTTTGWHCRPASTASASSSCIRDTYRAWTAHRVPAGGAHGLAPPGGRVARCSAFDGNAGQCIGHEPHDSAGPPPGGDVQRGVQRAARFSKAAEWHLKTQWLDTTLAGAWQGAHNQRFAVRQALAKDAVQACVCTQPH